MPTRTNEEFFVGEVGNTGGKSWHCVASRYLGDLSIRLYGPVTLSNEEARELALWLLRMTDITNYDKIVEILDKRDSIIP